LTVTVGTLPELVAEALAWSLAGVAAALAMAAEAAAIAIAPFMVVWNGIRVLCWRLRGEMACQRRISWESGLVDEKVSKAKVALQVSDDEGEIRRSNGALQRKRTKVL
jgi:hypothetical protein